MSEKTELKACPFCGGEAKRMGFKNSSRTWGWVECKGCGAGVVSYNNDRDPVAAWNTRAANSHDRLIEALEGLVTVIDAAGLYNLSTGVQLGGTVWYVKATDALDEARALLAQVKE